MKELTERMLDSYDFVSLVIDGNHFGDDEIIIALGITVEGEKVVLGIVQAGTENCAVCRDFLNEIIARGLRYDKGLLCIIDGAKGLRKAIDEVFGVHAIVQRCQWHKRENVVGYLPKNTQDRFRKRLQVAYTRETYDEAKNTLQAIKRELKDINEAAVKSLEEGFEETLTLQRLGMYRELRRSFATTNNLSP